jgi:uncharacterized protein with HEPN domain
VKDDRERLLDILEAVERLRAAHPGIPWPEIVAMRNVLVHDYFGVDVQEVWATVERDLPDLKQKIRMILEGLGERA